MARTLEELEPLRGAWDELPWEREEAAYEYFTTRLATRPNVIGPFAAVATSDGRPVGGLAGRLELRRLSTMLGYKDVYAPEARVLRVVDGGLAVGRADALPTCSGPRPAMRCAAARRTWSSLPRSSSARPSSRRFESLGGPLTRQPSHRSLDPPAARAPRHFRRLPRLARSTGHERADPSRRAATCGGVRRTAASRGGARPVRVDRLIEGAERVASSSYQRKLGVGLADTPEQRAVARVGLEHGWVRGYLLSLDATPIAYWLCSVFGDTILLRTGGYDPAFAENRVGIYLLMRVIEDACADPSLRTLDFGPGDAAYKQQFATGADTSGTSSSSPPASAAAGSTRPGPRSSRLRGSAATLDARA